MSIISASTTSTTAYKVTADTTGTLVFQTGASPTTAVTVDASQRIGIQTTNPLSTLVVSNGSNENLEFGSGNVSLNGGYLQYINRGTASTRPDMNYYLDSGGGAHKFYTGGSERMRLDASGNLLVGTASATYSASGRGVIEVNGSSTAIAALKVGGAGAGYIYHDGTNMSSWNLLNGALLFGTNNTERARIDSSGNLLVGTTSAGGLGNTLYKFSGGTYTVSNSSQTSLNHFIFQYNGTTVGTINTSTTATSYVTSSDYRLKENVAPMTGALAKVAALKPVTYTWKVDGSSGEGFIAHQLQAVVPDAVVGEKDAVDEEGNPKYQGIDTSFLVATLTAAIQEQQAIIETLTNRITALENK